MSKMYANLFDTVFRFEGYFWFEAEIEGDKITARSVPLKAFTISEEHFRIIEEIFETQFVSVTTRLIDGELVAEIKVMDATIENCEKCLVSKLRTIDGFYTEYFEYVRKR